MLFKFTVSDTKLKKIFLCYVGENGCYNNYENGRINLESGVVQRVRESGSLDLAGANHF